MSTPYSVVKWIPIEKIQSFLGYETFAIHITLTALAYLFYWLFLKKLSARRHGQMKNRFLGTIVFLILSMALASLHWFSAYNSQTVIMMKVSNYLGLLALIVGAITVIKVAQIYVYLYLFFSNMSTGVPRLIGNLFTCVFSIFIFALISSSIFNLNIATIATTSAVFSLVLGLALQDTLGNFFSGLALQVSRTLHINDWVEIQSGENRWVGQIQEINWRATTLLNFSDELVLFPNRFIGQGQITILSNAFRPVRLQQMFRFTYDTPIEEAKRALLDGLKGIPEIMSDPAPLALVTETTESWMTIKVFYSLSDYGRRYRVGDLAISQIMDEIAKKKLKLAHQTMVVKN